MSAIVLDAGAFVAADRGDRRMIARLRVAQQHNIDLRTSAIVIAQVSPDPEGRQARRASLLRAVDVHPVDEQLGREAGVLLGRARTRDPIDAAVVLIAAHGDRILTGDPRDLRHLAATAGKRVAIITC